MEVLHSLANMQNNNKNIKTCFQLDMKWSRTADVSKRPGERMDAQAENQAELPQMQSSAGSNIVPLAPTLAEQG